MAPEVFFGQPYNHAADIWSLGIIFYSMIVGECPFKANNYEQLRFELKKGFYIIPNKVKLSKEGQNFLQNCLQLNPASRSILESSYLQTLDYSIKNYTVDSKPNQEDLIFSIQELPVVQDPFPVDPVPEPIPDPKQGDSFVIIEEDEFD